MTNDQSPEPTASDRLATLQPWVASPVAGLQPVLGPFVVAADTARLAMIFTDGRATDSAIIFANDAFLALTGFARAAISEMPLNQLLGAVTDATTASSIRAVLDAGGSGSWEMQCRRANESRFPAAVFLSSVRDQDDGAQQNFLSIVELGGHVERLLDQRNELHALYEQAPGFIATADGPDHRFTFANASYKRFVGREELVGRTVAEALPEIVDQGFIGVLDEVFRTGEPFVGRSMPMGLIDANTGEIQIRYCDFVFQAVRNANGVICGMFCEGYDVTERREAADKLSALQADMIHVARVNAMGTMAATLAHELNQPLSAITNYAAGARRLVEHATPDGGHLDRALHGIEEAAQRAAEIIRNLRELTRRRDTTRGVFDLKTAVGECVRLLRATVPPGIAIVEDIADDLCVAADRVQIQQVLINLLRNACDAASGAATQQVRIEASEQDEMLLICVIDTGRGVTREAAENIFSWTRSAKEGGMGLGLSISRTIVEAHRGRIWLENSGPEGSKFCFSIPVATTPIVMNPAVR